MIFTKNHFGFVLSASIIAFGACTNDSDSPAVPTPTVVKEWNIALSAKNESPAPPGRNETGTANLKLMSDNSLQYVLNVSGLAAGDGLTAAHLHSGDAITSGPVILNLNPVFSAGSSTGSVSNVRQSLIDSLNSTANEIYVNVHSTQAPAGIARGQVNTTVELAFDVAMISANEVPAGTSAATGLGLLRLTSDKKAYVQVTVTGLEANDTLTLSHIHRAATGVNGPIILNIYANAAEFGTAKVVTVADSVVTMLKNDAIYFNAHSKVKPGGVIRGQIR